MVPDTERIFLHDSGGLDIDPYQEQTLMTRMCRALLPVICCFCATAPAQPIVMNGGMVPQFLGKNLSDLRMTDGTGRSIAFQIDEVTEAGEYVCDQGPEPNTAEGNGVLDSTDEISFLWEDGAEGFGAGDGVGAAGTENATRVRITVGDRRGRERRHYFLYDAPSVALSNMRYVTYDARKEQVETPWYYAQFGHDRFHFIRAGVRPPTWADGYINLTNELRIKIQLRTLFGLIPIRYTEDNIVCLVKRYKVGPIRLLRRGDFHLRLGLWIKGSNASVNQICYPQMVGVPVFVHLPVRFKTFFRDAYIEMTPVITAEGRLFSFHVPRQGVFTPLGGMQSLDTLYDRNPNNGFMTVDDGSSGYGWLLETTMPDSLMHGGGYIVKRPTDRDGIAHCGFRLTLRDIPKGYYLITNWVLFSKEGAGGLLQTCNALTSPARVDVSGSGTFVNRIKRIRTKAGKN